MDWLGLAGSAAQVIGTLAATSSTNQANADRALEDKAFQIGMWKANNAYNTPAAQVQRLREAGINPALAMQDSNPNIASSVPQTATNFPADFQSIGAGISNALGYLLQKRKTDAEVGLLHEQSEANRIDNMTRHAMRLQELQNLKAQFQKTGRDTDWIDWQISRTQSLFDAEYKKSYAEIAKIESDTYLNNALERESRLKSDYQDVLNRYAVPNSEKVLRNLDAEYENIMSAAASNNSQAALNAAQRALVGVNKDTAEKIQHHVVNKAFQEVESIKDERELKWLQENRNERGEGKRLPSPVGTYETSQRYYETKAKNGRMSTKRK